MIELNNCKSIKDIETRLIYKEDSLKKFEVNIGNSTKLKIKQISTQLIPEFQNEEVLINLCLNGKEIKTISSKFLNESNWCHVNLNNKIVDSKQFIDECIYSLTSSPHIYGECALALDNKIQLRTLRDDSNFEYFSIVNDLQPNFVSKCNWKNILFGSHPRNFIYTDYSRLCSIDTRLNPETTTEFFSINNEANKKFLNLNELIERNYLMATDLNAHVICCTNTLLIIDERFSSRPLLTWKHHLNSRPIHLNAFSFDDSNNSVLLCSDETQIYAYQFNLNENSLPISYNFPLKIDTLESDFQTYLPKNHDKRLKRHLNCRLEQPILSMSVVSDNKSFALFQVINICIVSIRNKIKFKIKKKMPANEDLYYQIFETKSNQMDLDNSYELELQLSNYEYWLGNNSIALKWHSS